MAIRMLFLLCILATTLSIIRAQTIGMHQLVIVEPSGDAVIRLLGYKDDKPSPKVSVNFHICYLLMRPNTTPISFLY